jgi:hypothetical protein
MQIVFRIAALRRAVAELALIAEQRAAQAEGRRAPPSFRALDDSEAKEIVGADLITALAAAAAAPKF